MKDGDVGVLRRNAEQGVMFFDDLRGVIHEAIDHVRRHREACAVPDVEDMRAPVHVPGAARSSVGFNDAVEEGIAVWCVKHVAV